MQRLPFMRLRSDVADVVYLNWVVDVDAIRGWSPDGVKVWQREGKTLLTILTYRHRHFGPAVAGGLRHWFGSPRQTNWRLYVERVDGAPADGTVLFIQNTVDSALYACGIRLFSDALPVHLAGRFEHDVNEAEGRFATVVTANGGSATPWRCAGRMVEHHVGFDGEGDGTCAALLGELQQGLSFTCLQHRAVTEVAAVNGEPARLAQSDIHLPIDVSAVVPLQVDEFDCPWLAPVIGHRQPWAFLVREVPFEVLSESLR